MGRWLSETADAVIAAGTRPELWRDIPERFAAAFPGTRTGLEIRTDGPAEPALGSLSHGFDELWLERYAAHYAGINPWIPLVARMPVLQAATSDATLPWTAITQTEFYNDFLQPQGEVEHGSGMKLVDEPGRFAWLYLQYGHGVAERYNVALPKMLSQLAPAFRASFSLARQLAEADVWRAIGGALLDCLDVPALVLDRRGQPRAVNVLAARALEDGDLVRLDARGRVRLVSHAATGRMIAWLAALAGPGAAVPCDIAARDGDGRPVGLVSLVPIPGSALDGRLGWLFEPERLVLMTVRPLARGAAASAGVLSMLFGLTRTEARLAGELAAGVSLDQAAAALGIGHETARSHLKAIFAKTATHRQAELVALISRLGNAGPSCRQA